MFIIICVFVGVLSLAGAMELESKLLEIGATGTIPCGPVGNDRKVRVVQWYKSRRIDAFEESGESSLAWRTETDSGNEPNFHLENTTFSLVIGKAKLDDEGLYKCTVLRGDLFSESNYLTRTFTYALPRMDLLLTLDTNLKRVNCTVEHVKPMIFPVFNFDWIPDSTETYVVLNEDGTYTTWVCSALPQNKSVSPVECSFSYLHYQAGSSLDLRDTSTDSLIEDKTNTISPIDTYVTSEGDGCRCMTPEKALIGLIFVGSSGILVVFLFEMMRRAKGWYYRRRHTSKKAEESEMKMFRPGVDFFLAEMTARDGLS